MAARLATPVRRLTGPTSPAEAKVIYALLAASAARERDRIRDSGLSPRTYQTARARIFESGWVVERFVPHPGPFGIPSIWFSLVAAEKVALAATVRSWVSEPATTLVWEFPEFVLGMGFGIPGSPPPRPPAGLPKADADAASFRIEGTIDQIAVPVFFDFGGAWARIVGLPLPRTYPHSMPFGSGAGSMQSPLQPSRRMLADARAAVSRPFQFPNTAAGGFHLGSLFHERSLRRAAEAGVVERRAFLELTAAPRVGSYQVAEVVFTTADFRSGSKPAELFTELADRCGYTPFLFVFNDRQLLMGSLAPRPLSLGDFSGSRIGDVLRGSVGRITVRRGRVSELSALVNHRYDRLFGASAGSPGSLPPG